MDCTRCLKLHGPGCPAAANVDGESLCIWCLDGISCERSRRLVKQLRSAAHDPLRFAAANANDILVAAAARKNSVTTAGRANGHDVTATSTRHNKHNGSARHREMLAVRAAAAAPAKPTDGHDKSTLRLSNDPAHGNGNEDRARSLGAAAAGKLNGHDVTAAKEDSMSSTSSTLTTHATSAPAPAARLCQHPRCTRELSPANRSGYCVAHRDLHRSHRKSSSNGNGGHARDARAPAAKSNGLEKTNCHVEEIAKRVRIMLSAIELPVDEVFAVLPEPDKARLIELWLTGAA
jgi:hypothetical protein